MNIENLALGYVATAPSPATTGTTLTLETGEGARFPATTTASFYATLMPADVNPHSENAEVVEVTDRTGDVLTIVRGQRGTTGKTVAVGWIVLNSVYKEDLDFATITGTETLTNKTLTSPTIAGTPVLDSTSAIPFYNDSLHRQAIINGNFDVWQRGTSFTPANAKYEVDRFITYFGVDGGTNPTLASSRQSITPGELDGSRYFYRLTTNGAGASYGTNAFYVFQQKIENGVRALCGNGKTVTLSFYAKSDIADKKIATYLEQHYGSGGTPTATEAIKGEEFSLTTSWAKYTTTFTTNTLTGKTFGTDGFDRLHATIELMWGATRGTTYHNDSGGAEDFGGSGNIDIAQVQLCAGEVALPFQPKSFEEELRACQRYYLPFIGFWGRTGSPETVIDIANVPTPTTMRSGVKVTLTGTNYFYGHGTFAQITNLTGATSVPYPNYVEFPDITVAAGFGVFTEGWANPVGYLDAEL